MALDTPPTLPARAPDRGERTRQRVLDAAGQCFTATSYSKTTVEEIAEKAGVSKGIVYHHFRGKEGILEALIERTLSAWEEVSGVERWIAQEGDLRRAVSGMLQASLRFARSHPLVRALFQLDPLVVMGLGSSAAVQRRISESRVHLVAAIERGIASGELRSDLAAERVADVLRLISFALIEHLLNPQWIDAADERFVDTCVAVFFDGVAGAGR
jgi:AcrR family transcriptional regulator